MWVGIAFCWNWLRIENRGRINWAKGLNDVLVIGGGVIPDTDIPGLKAAGVAEVFTPGTPTGNIVDFINANTH